MQWDIEGDAISVFRLAGHLDLDGPISMTNLSIGALGTRPIRPPFLDGESTIQEVKGRFQIFLHSKLTPKRAKWRIGHELAHWYYEVIRREVDGIESRCDALGAALTVPRQLLLSAVGGLNTNDPIILANELDVPQTLMVARLPECRIIEASAAATPRRTLVRGFEWRGEESALRDLIRTGGEGLRKIRITDEPNHYAVVMAA